MAPYNGNILVDLKPGKKRLSDFFLNRHVLEDNENHVKPNKMRRLSIDKLEVESGIYGETCKYATFFRCLNPNNNLDAERNSKKSISCQICRASFIFDNNRVDVFKKHAVQHSEIDNIKCLVCKVFKCRKESTIKNHLRDVHDQFPTRSTRCSLYSTTLSRLEQLTVNENTVKCFPELESILTSPMESSNFATCQVCQETVQASLAELQLHTRKHLALRNSVGCRICNIDMSADEINDHMLKKHHSNSDIYKIFSPEDSKSRKQWLNRCFPTLLH